MRYKDIILQAYTLTVRNPLYWLFGLVLLGGFNLYLINFFALVDTSEWDITMPFIFNIWGHSNIAGYLTFALTMGATFVVVNLIKIIFIVSAHGIIHVRSQRNRIEDVRCYLCSFKDGVTLPYFIWLKKVLLVSILTIGVTSGLTLATHQIISVGGYNQPEVVIVNVLVVMVVSCVAGAWNLFTGYFIVMHGLNFVDAASSAVGLMVTSTRKVVEFLIILSVIYSLSVVVGDGFIGVWRDGFAQNTDVVLRTLGLIVFIVWFAVNNTFFNLAMLLFFDSLVKAQPVEESSMKKISTPATIN